jgi:primosomal protein N' (replication factor Y)
VEHRYTNRLVCRLTGFSMPRPATCPHCGAAILLVSIGPGVERLEEASGPLPGAASRSSPPTPSAAPPTPGPLVESMAAGEIDILVATQAAAKGHNFPNLTLGRA